MKDITFNMKLFIRTVIIFLTLTIVWTALCILTDEFTEIDKGLISGFGFLVLLPTSIYFGQNRKSLTSFGFLTLLTIITFLVVSFILGPIVLIATNSMIIYSVVNSLFVSFVMTLFIDKIISIEFKTLTVVLTCLLLIFSYFIIENYSEKFYLNYNVRPRLTMFNVFQIALLIPLSIGMALKKSSANGNIIDH